MPEILRTPDHYFENLPNYSYQANYINIGDTRIHYLDEGKGETILCLHGEPSWSFLYRKFIPILSKKYRVICPDFIGFGKSDKYSKVSDYSFELHFNTLQTFIEQLNLKAINLVVQDWGGLIGLSVLGLKPELFASVTIMNTYLPIGKPMPLPFKLWQSFAKYMPVTPVGGIIKFGTYQPLSKVVQAAYEAPYPSQKYRAGAKAWPGLVPGQPTDSGVKQLKQARATLQNWNKPALIMFSDKDPVLGKGYKWFVHNIPSDKKSFIEIKDAGHFLQEDKGEEIAQHILDYLEEFF